MARPGARGIGARLPHADRQRQGSRARSQNNTEEEEAVEGSGSASSLAGHLDPLALVRSPVLWVALEVLGEGLLPLPGSYRIWSNPVEPIGEYGGDQTERLGVAGRRRTFEESNSVGGIRCCAFAKKQHEAQIVLRLGVTAPRRPLVPPGCLPQIFRHAGVGVARGVGSPYLVACFEVAKESAKTAVEESSLQASGRAAQRSGRTAAGPGDRGARSAAFVSRGYPR